MSVQWYVIRSKANKEMILWRELTARGFECFYPRLYVRPVNPRSRKIRSYFPGYVFVQTDIEKVGISMFQWMPFSIGCIAFDGLPATVPGNLVQAIRSHVDQINAADVEERAGIKPGEVVMIEGGPFDGYEAIFDARLPGSERVRVLLNLLQARQLSVELPEVQIQPRRKSQGKR